MKVTPQVLKQGDLLFVVGNNSAFSQAISDATVFNDSLSFVHVAILDSISHGYYQVIEASPDEGVRGVELEKFLENCPKINEKPGVVVKRITVDYSPFDALSKAKSHLGEGYDWWYMPENGKMYCSELVYESFFDHNGNRIFKSQPMNFRNQDGSMPDFWIKLFEQLGKPVPEGMEGTNPNDMAKDSVIVEIYRYF